MYEVARHEYGRKLITRDGPCQGLLEWPQHKWTRLTPRPVGLSRAKAIADAEPGHAVVCAWSSSEKVYDNGKNPGIPAGWWPANAHSVMEV